MCLPFKIVPLASPARGCTVGRVSDEVRPQLVRADTPTIRVEAPESASTRSALRDPAGLCKVAIRA